jgi:alpha-1,6-mannosyltransferase
MACATPVAVRDAGGLAEAVSGCCGIAVPSGDADHWAQAIEALCNPDAAMVGAALAKARSLDWSHVLAQLQRRYTAAIASRSGALAA